MKGRETGLNKKEKPGHAPVSRTPFDGRRSGRKGRSSFPFLLPLRLRGKGEIPPGGGGGDPSKKIARPPPFLFTALSSHAGDLNFGSGSPPMEEGGQVVVGVVGPPKEESEIGLACTWTIQV